MSEERKNLGIDDWLELVKEDKNLNGAYICFGQYMYLLEQENKQLKDKLEFYSGLELDKTIDKTRLEYNKLQQENKQLKNDNAVMKAGLIQASNKQLNLYKEIIKEVREYTKSHFKEMVADEEAQGLLQILDKEVN